MSHDQVLWQLLSALAVILTVVAGHLRASRDRNAKKESTDAKIADVQQTVNGTTHVLSGRVDQLAAALTAHGIAVPPPPDGEHSPQPEAA